MGVPIGGSKTGLLEVARGRFAAASDGIGRVFSVSESCAPFNDHRCGLDRGEFVLTSFGYLKRTFSFRAKLGRHGAGPALAE